jgi:acyl-CoA reductase-like NAD-dependent aldehyde dehydrogenase
MDSMEKNKSLVDLNSNGQSNGSVSKNDRIDVMKTYKIYIDGKFPRTESGRYYPLQNNGGKTIANICRSSRKDFREAVVAARKAQPGWASKSAYNRGQILYRMAEMLEGRREQFISELKEQGNTSSQAEKEINLSVDRLVYYAGWCDKYQQVFSAVNPVESSHFNFSVPEPMGVISMLAPELSGLLGLITLLAPAIAGGNTVVILASSSKPLSAITFGEVINSSDVPGGVVNILTGHRSELLSHFATHMDVNGIVYCGEEQSEILKIKESSSLNVKRVAIYKENNLAEEKSQSPYRIMDLQEIKTTWHPIGQ